MKFSINEKGIYLGMSDMSCKVEICQDNNNCFNEFYFFNVVKFGSFHCAINKKGGL